MAMTTKDYERFLSDFLKSRAKEIDTIKGEISNGNLLIRKLEQSTGSHGGYLVQLATEICKLIQPLRDKGFVGKDARSYDSPQLDKLFSAANTYLKGTCAALDKDIDKGLTHMTILTNSVKGVDKAIEKEVSNLLKQKDDIKGAMAKPLKEMMKLQSDLKKLASEISSLSGDIGFYRGYAAGMSVKFEKALKSEFSKTKENRDAIEAAEVLTHRLNPRLLKPKALGVMAKSKGIEALLSAAEKGLQEKDSAKRLKKADLEKMKAEAKVAVKAMDDTMKDILAMVAKLDTNGKKAFDSSDSGKLLKAMDVAQAGALRNQKKLDMLRG